MSRYEPLPEAVYLPDGDGFVPTALATGPWDPNAQHGGPVSALVARAMERHETPRHAPGDDALLARVSIDLLRPVPLERLEVRVRTVAAGRRAQRFEATVVAGDREVVRATGLRLTATPLALPEGTLTTEAQPSPPDAAASPLWDTDFPWLTFSYATESRLVRGHWDEPGPGTVWFRLTKPLVAGEDNTPVMRVMAAADYGNGVGNTLDFAHYTFVNPDLTVSLHRYPEGEWVCLDAVSWAEPSGVGMAEGRLYDRRGRIGRSVQALVISRRQTAFER